MNHYQRIQYLIEQSLMSRAATAVGKVAGNAEGLVRRGIGKIKGKIRRGIAAVKKGHAQGKESQYQKTILN